MKKNIYDYIEAKQTNVDVVDESLKTSLVKVGILLLAQIIPVLISLGLKIFNLNIDKWVNDLIKKFPKYKDAILILDQAIRSSSFPGTMCDKFVNNSINSQPSKHFDYEAIEKEIVELLSDDDEKIKKVHELFNFIQSDEFNEKIDE